MQWIDIIKRNKAEFVLLIYAALMPFITESVILYLVFTYQETISAFSYAEWTIIYILISFGMALAFMHTTFVATTSGYFFGWPSLFFVIPGYLIASAIGYWLARKADNGKLNETLTGIEKARKIKEELKENEMSVIFLSRISPVLPFALMNFLLSFLRADFIKFLVAGFAGMLPRTMLFVYIGMQTKELINIYKNPGHSDLSQISFSILTIISIAGLYFFVNKAIKRAATRK
ncbi:MAG: TVP38/TMEM64 family protein [Cytophagaceae bacterium]